MTGEEPQELLDHLDEFDRMDQFTLGAESTEELGMAEVNVMLKDGPSPQVFDSVTILEIAGTTFIIGQEAVRDADGNAHLHPTTFWPAGSVDGVQFPMNDERLEFSDGERIGVNR